MESEECVVSSSPCKNDDKKINNFSIWLKNSLEGHEFYLNGLGDRIWDEFEIPKNEVQLYQKIGMAFFGPPKDDNNDLGYSDDQKKIVSDVIEKCKEHSSYKDKIYLGVIFISVFSETYTMFVPLLRVKSNADEEKAEDVKVNVFIDHLGRVYSNFENYFASNPWDMCYLCFPKNGYYNKFEPDLSFKDQTSQGKTLNHIDKASNVVNIVSTLGMFVGIGLTFTPLAPIGATTLACSTATGIPGAVYGFGRSVAKISDRAKHQQKIGLDDPEARQYWITTAASVAGFGSACATRVLGRIARTGGIVSNTTKGVCTSINVTSILMSGAGLANSCNELLKKKSEDITSLELLQFTTSVLFFTHSIIQFKSAQTLFEEAQQNVIANMKENISADHHEKYDRVLESTKKIMNKKNSLPPNENSVFGKAEFIRRMKNIDNHNEYFENIKLTKKGSYCINNKLTINSKYYEQLTEKERNTLFSATKDLQEGKISEKAFDKNVEPMVKKYQMGVRKTKIKNFQSKINNRATNLSPKQVGYDKIPFCKDRTKKNKGNKILKSYNNKEFEAHKEDITSRIRSTPVFDEIVQKMKRMALNKNVTQKIMKMLQKIVIEKIQEYMTQSAGASPGEIIDDICRREVEQAFSTPGNELYVFLTSLTDLAESCEQSNIEIPTQCFLIVMKYANGPISNIRWTKNEFIVQCSYLSEGQSDVRIDFQIRENICVVIFHEAGTDRKPEIFELNQIEFNFENKIESKCDRKLFRSDGDLRGNEDNYSEVKEVNYESEVGYKTIQENLRIMSDEVFDKILRRMKRGVLNESVLQTIRNKIFYELEKKADEYMTQAEKESEVLESFTKERIVNFCRREVEEAFCTPGNELNVFLTSLTDLAISCEQYKFEIPTECFLIIMKNANGSINNIRWTKNEFIVQCTYLSENNSDVTIDFQIKEHFCVSIFHETDTDRKPEVFELNQTKFNLENKIENKCDIKLSRGEGVLFGNKNNYSEDKEVNSEYEDRYSTVQENLRIISGEIFDKIGYIMKRRVRNEKVFQAMRNKIFYELEKKADEFMTPSENGSELLELSSEERILNFCLRDFQQAFRTPGNEINIFFTGLSDLAASCKLSNIKIPTECFLIIMKKVNGPISNIRWTKNEFIVQCTYFSEGQGDVRMDFQIKEQYCVMTVHEKGIVCGKPEIYRFDQIEYNFESKIEHGGKIFRGEEDLSENEYLSEVEESEDDDGYRMIQENTCVESKLDNYILASEEFITKIILYMKKIIKFNGIKIKENIMNIISRICYKIFNETLSRGDKTVLEWKIEIDETFFTLTNEFNNFFNGLLKLVVACERDNIHIPIQCLETLMGKIWRGLFYDVTWLNNGHFVSCTFSYDGSEIGKVDFLIGEVWYVLYNFEMHFGLLASSFTPKSVPQFQVYKFDDKCSDELEKLINLKV